MVSATVAFESSISPGLPSPSAVGPSSAPPLPFHGDTISEDLQGRTDMISKERDAVTRLIVSRLIDLESVGNDLAVVSNVNRRNATASRLCSKKSQPRGEIILSTSEAGASRALRHEPEVSSQRLPGRDAEIDRFRKVLP